MSAVARFISTSPRRAFTLVELLVVIGIIAVLISLLLPALNRARDAAISANCLSNMREVGNAMQMYAIENSDKVPIGHFNNRLHESYVISFKASAAPPDTRIYPILGHLYQSGLMKDPRAFWCPSPNHIDDRWTFNGENNPWPPELGVQFIRAGYYTRPGVTWSAGLYPLPSTGGMPKLSKFKSKAILSDLWPLPLEIGALAKFPPHRRTQNVLFGDRSAQALPVGPELQAKFDVLNTHTSAAPPAILYLNEDPAALGMWNLYDRR
jgi:prepilin-type N-terminal cleavage/methylation domain-containing protein